jgi:outer membrane biogenesis lipoprotein LolB
MNKKIIYEVIKIVCTAVISVAAVLFHQSCAFTASIQKNNSNSNQTLQTDQTTKTSIDSTKVIFD